MSMFWSSFTELDLSSELPVLDDGDDSHSDINDTEEYKLSSAANFDSAFIDADFDDLLKKYGDDIETSDILPYRRDVRIVINVAYIVLIVISLFGNTLVCVVTTRSSQMRNVTNFFLANQAFSDIIMTLFNIPLVLTRDLSDDWPYGRIMCYITDYIIQASTFVSGFTLTAIAIDRRKIIAHPLRPRMDVSSACLISCIIWTLSLILSLPSAVFRTLYRWETPLRSGYKCIASYPNPSEFYSKVIIISSITLRYIIPLIIIASMYRLISTTLRGKMTIGFMTASQRAAKDQSKRRTTTMLIMVVTVFAVTWFPLNFYLILVLYFESLHNNVVHLVLYYFAMIGVCVNPFLYSWLNVKFRTEIKSILRINQNTKIPKLHNGGTGTKEDHNKPKNEITKRRKELSESYNDSNAGSNKTNEISIGNKV